MPISTFSDPKNDRSEVLRRLRILWASNAPWASTGYGVQTKLFVPRLRALGHTLGLHCLWGLEGGVINWNDIVCYPRGHHTYSQDVMMDHARNFRADLVILLFDAWVLEATSLNGKGPRCVPWYPVDSDPMPSLVRDRVAKTWRSVVYSKFGLEKAREAGIPSFYIPHGIDTNVYRPLSRHLARARVGFPSGAFVVGMVAANRGVPSRKAFPQCMAAFAEFRRRHPDALLYLHTTTGGRNPTAEVDLLNLAVEIGIDDALVFPDQYVVNLGLEEERMADLYCAIDVLLSPSMGEGFGVPILEAQSSGCPVIVGDWTSMTELCHRGFLHPKTDAEPFMTSIGGWQFLPRASVIASLLEDAYRAGSPDDAARTEMHNWATQYDADRVTTEHWKPFLDDCSREISDDESVRKNRSVPLARSEPVFLHPEKSEIRASPHCDAEVVGNAAESASASNGSRARSISIVTPWRDHPELIPDYVAAVKGADVIVVDNASRPDNAALLEKMVRELGGTYLRNEENRLFSAANNQGLAVAKGSVVVFMNNDIVARGPWLHLVEKDVVPGAILGPSVDVRDVDSRKIPFVGGWCIAARRETWDALAGWDEATYPGLYWEDNDISLRAMASGFKLVRTAWPIIHLSGRTSRDFSSASESAKVNMVTFIDRVRDFRRRGLLESVFGVEANT